MLFRVQLFVFGALCTLLVDGAAAIECYWMGGCTYCQFWNCEIPDFRRMGLPSAKSPVSLDLSNAFIYDIDGCVRWLANITQLRSLTVAYSPSFLECLTKFNRSFIMDNTPNKYGFPNLTFVGPGPDDKWINTTAPIVFADLAGKSRRVHIRCDPSSISDRVALTRVPPSPAPAFNVTSFTVELCRITTIKEHDFDGYVFADPFIDLSNNKVCTMELAVYNHLPPDAMIWLDGSGLNPGPDISTYAAKYPGAIALGGTGTCASALPCYRVLDQYSAPWYLPVLIVDPCDAPLRPATARP